MGKRIVLKDHLAKLEERAVEIEAPDGTVFHVPPPELWPDEIMDAVGPVAEARVILGSQYQAWLDAGGTARVLLDIVNAANGETIPES